MVDLTKIITAQRTQKNFGGSKAIFPAYGGFSLANLPASICQWLGVSIIGGEPLNSDYPSARENFDRVVVIMVDGLGWNLLQRWVEDDPSWFLIWKELGAAGWVSPLTSISPSTTCAALTTLNTGVTAVEHGNLAYELWLKEFGVVANMITHAPMAGGEAGSLQKSGFLAADFIPVPTLDSHLISQGLTVSVHHPAGISRSSLTGMLYPQAELHGYHSLGDLWYRLQQVLASNILPAYHFFYWSAVDALSHLYSPDDIRVKLAFRDFTRYLDELMAAHHTKKSQKTLLIITADHGQISTPIHEIYNLNNHRALTDCFSIQPTGENRMPFLHCKPGMEKLVEEYVERHWPGEFELVSAEQILGGGLLGDGIQNQKTLDRLGDLVVIPHGNGYWWWSSKPNRLLGRHGGLSADEMLVPLAMLTL